MKVTSAGQPDGLRPEEGAALLGHHDVTGPQEPFDRRPQLRLPQGLPGLRLAHIGRKPARLPALAEFADQPGQLLHRDLHRQRGEQAIADLGGEGLHVDGALRPDLLAEPSGGVVGEAQPVPRKPRPPR
jgi:hypothetical protein